MDSEVPQNPTSVPDGNLTVNPEPQKKSNVLLILLSILVLVLVGSGGFILARYLYTSKPEPLTRQPSVTKPVQTQAPFSIIAPASPAVPPTDETVDWKTYENKDLGFSFKYPKEAKLKVNKATGVVLFNLSLDKSPLIMNLSLYRMDSQPLYDWVVSHGPNGSSGYSYFPSAREIKISQREKYPAVEFTDTLPEIQEDIKHVVFSLNNNAYDFSLGAYDLVKKDFDQILSTFKFL